MDELARAQGRWRRKLNGEAFPVLERWLKRSARYESYHAEAFDRAPGLCVALVPARCCVLVVVCCFCFGHMLSFDKSSGCQRLAELRPRHSASCLKFLFGLSCRHESMGQPGADRPRPVSSCALVRMLPSSSRIADCVC